MSRFDGFIGKKITMKFIILIRVDKTRISIILSRIYKIYNDVSSNNET